LVRFGGLSILFSPANAQDKTALNTDGIRDEIEVCDAIDGLGVTTMTDVSGVTAFVAEACAATEVMGSSYRGSALTVRDVDLQNLTDYFERPRLAKRYTLTAGSRAAVDTLNVTYDALFNNTTGVFVNGATRLTGVFGLRFKLRVRLQVAATPFHQGVVALSWQYHADNSGTMGIFNRNSLPQTCTNLPHVRLDISQQTMVELEVPFMHTNEFMTTGEVWPYGSLGINTLLPYESVAGMGAPTLELYYSLHDMEFFGAAPQAVTTIVPQAGAAEKEQEDDSRPFSSSVYAASRSIKYLAKGVPSISSLATPVTWFLDASAGALRAFGFSRPNIKDPVIYMFPSANVREINTDIPTPAIMVGPKADNHLAISTGFGGHDVDDMALSYITSQWGQINVGNFPTSLTHGSALYAARVGPSYFWFRQPSARPLGNKPAPIASGAAKNAFVPSHLFWIGQMFRFWRGNIKYRFTFSKTKMHGGRLLCSFIPRPDFLTNSDGVLNNVQGPESVGGVTQPFGHSAIFDLRDNNVFEFEVPYVAATPYLNFWSSVGDISLVVIDPLVATANVATQVGVLVEVCGGTNYELAVPVSPIYPAMGNVTAGNIIVQSGLPATATNDSTSTLTIGEKLMSVKQLIMMPKWTDTLGAAIGLSNDVIVPPWFYHRNPPNTAPFAAGTQFVEAYSFGGNIATAYTWARGSTELHAYAIGSFPFVWFNAKQAPNDYNKTWLLADGYQGFRGRSSTPMVLSDSNCIHAKFPAYTGTARIPAGYLNNSDYNCRVDYIPTAPVVYPGLPSLPTLGFRNLGTAAVDVRVGRAAGDDAALSMYIGPCPLAVPPAGAATANFDPDIKFQ